MHGERTISGSVIIRPAKLEEAAGLVAMYEWLFAPPGTRPPHWDPERGLAVLRRLIRSEGAEVLVADHSGELVGICTVYRDIDSVRFGGRAWVEDLAVHPEWRSKRLGKRLLDAAKEWALAHGATHLELDSAETREAAHRFYERERPSWRSVCFAWEL